ncbi:ARF GTPase-activating protein GIT2-like [Haliotis rubra]|uniref:ARF GTPase-activating protein GIT2-like n=1 Tax=Haliotis rubra TaxID=36100 RepID=UPI001EE5B1A1|nr:ARF GTPase-activating protein GIT2-like [Haliotis rubra]
MSRGTMYSTACADCGASDPVWASINRGVLICDECCSVHRSLGRHISQVKSLKKGQWSPTQHAMVYQLAKQGANNIWEHALLDPSQNKHGRRKPNPREPLHPNKSDFIRAKYQFLSFVNKHKDSDISSIDDVSKELHSSVRTNNVETCLRLLSKGADPNYFHLEKGNCPLHIAAQANQASQVELLVVYGADPGALDLGGKTPIDYARAEGHNDLADRLVEIQYELTDRLAFYVCGKKPGPTLAQGPAPGSSDGLRQSHDWDLPPPVVPIYNTPPNLFRYSSLMQTLFHRHDKKLYNLLFSPAVWLATHDNTTLLSDRQTVPFLPVNPDLSTTRNQGRQKLARFNAREFATLIIDILNDARRRQTGIASPVHTPKEPDKYLHARLSKGVSAFSDDEPLYDSVASDEDYSSIDTISIKSMREEMRRDKPADSTTSILCRGTERDGGTVAAGQYLTALIDSLIKENSALKSINMQRRNEAQVLQNGYEASKGSNSGNPEYDSLDEKVPQRPVRDMRPQSMFEPRTSLQKSQSREDQLQTCLSEANIRYDGERLGDMELSLPSEPIDPDVANANIVPDPDYDMPNDEDVACASSRPCSEMTDSMSSQGATPKATAFASVTLSKEDLSELPSQEDVVKKTEKITKKIQELLLTAQANNSECYGPCSEKIYSAVVDMAELFPQPVRPDTVNAALQLLTMSAARLQEECRKCAQQDQDSEVEAAHKTQLIIQFAYDIAKAAKQLVTLFQ